MVLGLIIGLMLLGIILISLTFIFWLFMMVDCVKRDFKKDTEKIVWVLVIIFLHVLGAAVYYFVVKLPDKSVKKK